MAGLHRDPEKVGTQWHRHPHRRTLFDRQTDLYTVKPGLRPGGIEAKKHRLICGNKRGNCGNAPKLIVGTNAAIVGMTGGVCGVNCTNCRMAMTERNEVSTRPRILPGCLSVRPSNTHRDAHGRAASRHEKAGTLAPRHPPPPHLVRPSNRAGGLMTGPDRDLRKQGRLRHGTLPLAPCSTVKQTFTR